MARFKERREKNLSGVIAYLHHPEPEQPDEDSPGEHDLFGRPSHAAIRGELKRILERLAVEGPLSGEDDPTTDLKEFEADRSTVSDCTASLQDQLEARIQKSMGKHQPVTITKHQRDLMTTIKKEMSLFDNGGTRGHHLTIVYNYLLTIPPTSVEAERAFSAAGLFSTKLRSKLADETLNSLCFLRAHFMKNEKKKKNNFYVPTCS